MAPTLGLAALAVMSLSGCGPTANQSAQFSAAPTAPRTATASPTAAPTPLPTPTPTFVATGSMHDPRLNATATLLQNGKVLIAGGAVTDGLIQTDVASADLYDPATGKFTQTGSMTTVRSAATTTLLPDGRVLIAGGYGCVMNSCNSGTLSSAETYDPATGKFSRVGSMPKGFIVSTATSLHDGGVLLVGGTADKAYVTAELYDPTSGRFVRTGDSLLDMFYGADTTTLLPNGKVLMIGKGYDRPVAELYDPASGKFTSLSFDPPKGPAVSAQYNGKPVSRTAPDTATVLKDGRVLLFENGYLETYDPATGEFAPAGFMHAPGQWNSPLATRLNDGRVLFEGGDFVADLSNWEGAAASGAALYDPNGGPQLIGPLDTSRLGQTATLLPDGSVLIAGGTSDGTNALSSAELFKP
jgi:WD40 repeat protein